MGPSTATALYLTSERPARADSRHGPMALCDVYGCERAAAYAWVRRSAQLPRDADRVLAYRCGDCYSAAERLPLSDACEWVPLASDGGEQPRDRDEQRQVERAADDVRPAAGATDTTRSAHRPSTVQRLGDPAVSGFQPRDGAPACTDGVSAPVSGCAGPACRGETSHDAACLICVHGLTDAEGMELGLCTCARAQDLEQAAGRAVRA